MGKLTSAAFALLLAAAALTFVDVEGQAIMDESTNFWQINEEHRILLIANYLADNRGTTEQILKIAKSLQWLVSSTNGDPVGSGLMPAVLDYLPTVFNSSAFKAAVFLAFDEIQRAAPDNVTKQGIFQQVLEYTNKSYPNIKPFDATFNQTLQKFTLQYMLNSANKFRGLNRYLMLFSARDVLYEVSENRTVNPQCYSDTMDFIDAIVGAHVRSNDPRTQGLPVPPLQSFGWALKMLDSYGKPSGGIMKGALQYVGSHDECLTVHAYLPNDKSLMLGNRPHNYTTEFDTRFCRVTFNVPDSISETFGVDTHGIKLRLHWGMCVPDTCNSDDIAAMFHLGQLHPMNLSVYTVYCGEEEELSENEGAIFALCFLALLVGTVLVCTLFEAWVIFYNNNFAPPATPSHSSIEDQETYVYENEKKSQPMTVYHNAAFEPDPSGKKYHAPISESSASTSKAAEAALPVSYVQHKEDPPVFKDGLARPATVDGARAEPKKVSPPPSYTKVAKQENVNEKIVPKFVKAFSVLTNMPKILSGKKSPSAIHCLHGIRFFSLLWVILGHTYNYGVISVVDNPTTVNLVDADAIFKRFTFQGIMAGGFAVDTFFLLSGLLVTWLTLRDMSKRKFSIGYWIMFYFHRFWRLTPPYMIVLMFFTCLHTYMGGGPLWPKDLTAATNCKHTWWTNFLYVNNLVKVDDMCMGWTWYLSNDMQFYWISPFLLLPMFYFAPVGLILTILLLCTGIICAFYFEYQNGGDVFTMHEDGSKYWDEVYIPPWCRVAAYTVGMLLGYIFYKFKQRTLKMSTAVIGWLCTWAVGLLLCYCTYSYRKEGGHTWPRGLEATYESFGRPLWAACIGWIIFACHNNRGGFINSILSWEGFLPLSRLTYACYLIHPIVMMIHIFSKRALIYINDFDMAYLYMGHAVTSFLSAFVISLVAEAPALALEKLVFRLR